MRRSQEARQNRQRVFHWLLYLTLGIFIVFLLRLGQVMLLGQADGVHLANNTQAFYQSSSILNAKRGAIYDQDGKALALDANSYSLYAVLTNRWASDKNDYVNDSNRKQVAKQLAQHLPLKEKKILEILKTPHVNQVEFGNAGAALTYAEMQAIKDLKLPGIQFQKQPGRTYPNGVFASHLLGYAQYQTANEPLDSRLVGQLGLEKSQDELLAGQNGFKAEKHLADKDQKEGEASTSAKDGRALYLTLNSKLQAYMENLLTQICEKYEPDNMTAMLVDPTTGDIVAASQRPTFNPQTREGLDAMWKNLLVEDSYEPGSTMKVLTLAAAIEEGVFDPNNLYQSGAISIGGGVIRDYNRVGWGTISELDGVARSSNVLFVQLVGKIGYDKWKEYMINFGLFQKPQAGLGNETAGSLSYDYELDKVSTGFGQGLRVSPWQMMQAFTAVGDQGVVHALRLIDRYENKDKELVERPHEERGRVISPETAAKTRAYLRRVVEDEHGTGTMYAIDGQELAVKTGTAEIFDPKTNSYLHGGLNYQYSVVGFAPADEPRYVLYLTMEKPKEAPAGVGPHQMLAEVFIPLLKRALAYSEDEQAQEPKAMPDMVGNNVGYAQQYLAKTGLTNVVVLGSGGQVQAQWPKKAAEISPQDTVYLKTDGGMQVPDFTALNRAEAEDLGRLLGVDLKIEGEGLGLGKALLPAKSSIKIAIWFYSYSNLNLKKHQDMKGNSHVYSCHLMLCRYDADPPDFHPLHAQPAIWPSHSRGGASLA